MEFELKELFDKRFPASLRFKYRSIETSEEINEGLRKIWEINKIDIEKITNKYLIKQTAGAKYIG